MERNFLFLCIVWNFEYFFNIVKFLFHEFVISLIVFSVFGRNFCLCLMAITVFYTCSFFLLVIFLMYEEIFYFILSLVNEKRIFLTYEPLFLLNDASFVS